MWGDDNDEDLLRAMEESRRMYEEVEVPRLSQQIRAPSPNPIRDDSKAGPSSSYAEEPFKRPYQSTPNQVEDVPEQELYDGSEAEGFNLKTGQVWVYPTSDKYPVRTYQREIVEKALFSNTLVSLPTGLGKTFIAAVVMYNYYMWYPKGKIIFMAPTKPLVAQQIENCINILGIPESDTAEMTGALSSKMRAVMWKEKRVFFLTPQCVQNDLTSSVCPAKAVKCVVIDEAHRALGDHAYAQVIRILNSYEVRFRVLALSATPGSDLEAVQKVVTNLMISHIELRSEDSADIVPYTHQRKLELMVVDVGPTIYRIRAKFIGIATEYAKSLQQQRLLFGNVGSMARFSVLKEWENFRQEGARGMDPARSNKINTDFSLVHTFVHGLELLQTYGLRLLLNHIKGALNKGDLAANRLSVNDDLKALIDEIESVLNPVEIDDEEGGTSKKRLVYGHPKLDRLQEIIVSHFENFERKGEATRTIVFCEYREGVMEICEMLKNFQPLVKPVAFMGQSVGKTSKGISQKQQLEIMEKFKKGIYNTLVSTSVGEEGLDIGEVDLIICFDAKNSPIRQVQRMGRTGRKRQGKIIMLVTRGKEEMKYNQGLFKKKSVGSILLNRENLASHLLEESPRMLPPGIQPKYTERKVIPAPSKPKSNQQDLRKMFQKRTAGGGAGTSKSSVVVKPHIGKVDFLSAEDFAEMKLVWDNIEDCCVFDKIPLRKEFWSKSAEVIENQLPDPRNIDLATYLEFMRFKQRTHVIGNSSDSVLLTTLLSWADDKRDSDQSGGFSSQITSTQLWPTKSKKRGRPPTSDDKSPNPPKKRGRPKKATTCNSPFKPKEVTSPDNPLPPPNKPKSKPQFIDDDEFSPQDPPPIQGPSTSVFLAPLPPPPVSSRPADTSTKSSIVDKSSIAVVDEIIIDSDEDDDFNQSSSGFAYMSSQANRQDLYSDLSRALKNQAPDEDEDGCLICDAFFPCSSLNSFVLQKKAKVDVTWESMRKSLEEAVKLVPQLTKDVLSKYHKPIQSQRLVSLTPKYEFPDDEIFDGLLCGGVGDLSSYNTSNTHHKPRTSSEVNQSDIKMETIEEENLKQETTDFPTVEYSSSSAVLACSTPRKEQQAKEEKHQFDQDDSFDFLGLSHIDDVFVSQHDKKSDGLKWLDKTSKDSNVAKPLPMKASKSPENNENQFVCTASLKTPKLSPVKPKESVKEECVTPSKKDSVPNEQVSPILGSQAMKKPRLGLRLRKRHSLNESISSRELDGVSNTLERNQSVKREPECTDEVVTSSSEIVPSQNCFIPPKGDFDLFDDDFFKLSGQESSNKSEIDDSLKEAILQKAMEAKAKPAEENFTQKMKKLCETSESLTQFMDMAASEERSNHVQIVRAVSSSPEFRPSPTPSPSPRTSPIMDGGFNDAICMNDDGAASEEDLFADCDGDSHVDSFLCRINSTEFASQKQPSQQIAKEVSQSLLSLKEANPTSRNILDSDNAKLLNGERNDVKDEAVPSTDRSLSPVLIPVQTVRKPSKLSLKKTKTEVSKSVTEQQVIEDRAVSLKTETPPKNYESEIKKQVKEKKQPDMNSEIDFSTFGDEFNNSWLLSQEKELENAHTNNAPSKCDDNVSDSMKCSQDLVNQNEVELCQNSRSVRDCSPENELDVAFAKLKAAQKRLRDSFEGSVSTSNGPSGASSWFQTRQNDTPFSSKIQPSSSKLSRGKKLSRTANISSVAKNKPMFSSPSKSGWLSTKNTKAVNNVISPKDDSTEKSKLNLSDFCDDSLLDVFEMPTIPTTENPKTSFKEYKEAKGDEDVVVVLSSDDETVIPGKKKGKNCVLDLTSSSEEGLLLKHTDFAVDGTTIDSPLVKKRNGDFLDTSSSSYNFIKKPRSTKSLRAAGVPSDSSNIVKTLDLSNFCDESLLSNLDESSSANVIKGAPSRRRQDFLSSSEEEDFVRKDKKVLKVKKKEAKKVKKSKKANGFIVSEAVESDDGKHNSSDGESTSLDELDSSFINDSQPEASQSVVDIHAKYLQSVKSPGTGLGRFKIPNRLPEMDMDNVYSQYPDADELEQTYADDSFCVDDEPTQYEPEMSLLELAEARLKAERKEKRRLKKALKNGDTAPKRVRALESDESEEEIQVKKKRKRICVLEETMCEREVTPVKALLPSVKPDKTTESKVVTTMSVVEDTKNSKVKEIDDSDLASLFNDDFDFDSIPDPTPAVTTKPPPQAQPSSFKFVKKTPFLQSGGSTVKAIPHNGWKMSGDCSNLTNNLASTSRQAAVSNTTSYVPKGSHNAPDVVQKPVSSAIVAPSENKSKPTGMMMKVFIIASSRQIATSPDLLRVLRVNYQITLVPCAVQDADFIVSWRLGVCRILSSDLKDRKKLEELVKKLKLSFGKPHLIVENDRIKSLATSGYAKKGKKGKVPIPAEQSPQTLSPWSANIGCGNAALLRQAGVQLLFSQNFDETARFLAKLGMKETKAGHGIPEIAYNLPDELETRLEFFCSLPCVNYAFALKLLGNFATLSEFFSRCSTVLNIVNNLGVDINAAKRIFSVISEAHL
ncbi:uncharacterized protein LOC117650447 [Thrips palmi]|uniref:Uncharacterized protein LOC117650447 n=1 Tax=Thrips palmi TaxID=161013 RepID=A0A6P8ZY79_THRPL|nr:uncharacterized protein LOC117650447 [Thrips palmi]XP_034249793.1 uncharacterized protein LOC117650447 [Thrips palmi]